MAKPRYINTSYKFYQAAHPRYMLDICTQNWYANINNSRRLSMYSLYKHEFNLENYLKCINYKKYRISLSKFRLSSHDLAIERGRYANIEVENRKCLNCNLNAIETEYHFLLVCPKYRELRRTLFKPYYCHWPTLQKFETLMICKSKKTLNNLAKFIYLAFQMRH